MTDWFLDFFHQSKMKYSAFVIAVQGNVSGKTPNVYLTGPSQVGSRRVVQWGALVVMTIGVVGKFGAVFVSIPDPIVGGVFMVMFGMIAAVGISNLQFADMNSSRNLFIVGFSIVFGLALPHYMENHPNAIETGMLLAVLLLYQLAK